MERNPEPRIGFAPFVTGSEKPESDGVFRIIRSPMFPLGSLGEAYVQLQRPLIKRQKDEVSKKDQAFTIEPSGEIKTGKLLHFIKQGYYTVAVFVMPYNMPIDESGQKMNVNLWINGTGSTVTADLRTLHDRDEAYFFEVTDKGAMEEFVLPNNHKILKALRVNVSSN